MAAQDAEILHRDRLVLAAIRRTEGTDLDRIEDDCSQAGRQRRRDGGPAQRVLLPVDARAVIGVCARARLDVVAGEDEVDGALVAEPF